MATPRPSHVAPEPPPVTTVARGLAHTWRAAWAEALANRQGFTAQVTAADGALTNLPTRLHSHRGDGRLPGLLATGIRQPPLS